jgi:hypothetical protein
MHIIQYYFFIVPWIKSTKNAFPACQGAIVILHHRQFLPLRLARRLQDGLKIWAFRTVIRGSPVSQL